MPPLRTMPPAKAVKTERTHEENQERAYIAASRRSDRSLEARVESARRASEIHKKRTGRSLRVTEQDVINEEMYEEEEDDLPLQYRRLAAHLTTSNVDFNRRLNDYLATQVAMRSALANSYGQQFPNPGQTFSSMFPSPMLAHQQGQPQMMQPQIRPNSPTTYRQAPYPSRPQQQNFQNTHQRSASIAVPQEYSNTQRPPSTERRFSTPSAAQIASLDNTETPTSATNERQRPSFPRGSFSNLGQHQQQSPNMSFPTYNPDNNFSMGNQYSTLSVALPLEAQQLLGSTLDSNDPLTAMMMVGADSSQIYDFGSQSPSTFEVDKHQSYPDFGGMNSTLAPSAILNTFPEVQSEETAHDTNQGFFDPASGGLSGNGTPGPNGESWATFIDMGEWETPSSSQ
ncbi:hypothetical protein B0O99DRAFT_283134 [Bisporella sp. PMI_857]|nr:hypothetical protein B0O99DRAFT_283134 [Bisporella sp. PMI_857]